MNAERRAKALEAIEQATDLPMSLLAVAFIPLLVLPAVMPLSETTRTVFTRLEWLIWAVFALELAVKTYLAPQRGRYLLRHWFDVLIVALPFLRPLRVIRSARALRVLTALRLFGAGTRVVVATREMFGRHGLQYVVVVCAVLFVASAGAVTYFERNAGGAIKDFPTALWWAAVTVTTVGYGDTFPVTAEGRGVGVFLMGVGIALFSLLTANIAAFFVASQPQSEGTAGLEEVLTHLRRIEEQLAELRGRLPKEEG